MKAIYFYGRSWNIAHIFYFFRPIWIKFGTVDLHKNLWSNCEFRENWRSARYALFRAINEFLILTSHINFPIWVQFGRKRDFSAVLLSMHEFEESQFREGHILLESISKITVCMCSVKLYNSWKVRMPEWSWYTLSLITPFAVMFSNRSNETWTSSVVLNILVH
jgi:hypothetical protein